MSYARKFNRVFLASARSRSSILKPHLPERGLRVTRLRDTSYVSVLAPAYRRATLRAPSLLRRQAALPDRERVAVRAVIPAACPLKLLRHCSYDRAAFCIANGLVERILEHLLDLLDFAQEALGKFGVFDAKITRRLEVCMALCLSSFLP